MGCHARFYKRIDLLTAVEKEKLSTMQIQKLKRWWGFELTDEELVKSIEQWNDEGFNIKNPKIYAKSLKSKYVKKLEGFKKCENVDERIFYCIKEKLFDSSDIVKRKGYLYVLVHFDYPFRVYGYPEKAFYKKDMLVKWLKNTNHMITYKNKDDKRKQSKRIRYCHF